MTFAVNELLTCILNCDARLGLHVDCKISPIFCECERRTIFEQKAGASDDCFAV